MDHTARDAALERLVDLTLAAGSVASQTDKYFTNTARIVAAHGQGGYSGDTAGALSEVKRTLLELERSA